MQITLARFHCFCDITPTGQYPPPTQYPLDIEDMQVAAAATTPVTRKPVPAVSATSQMPSPAPGGQELSGQPIRRELGGTELHPFLEMAFWRRRSTCASCSHWMMILEKGGTVKEIV
ncbi:hypothetical protein N657DRAFT_376236 [Parathielavia appendiculata]|uniref:Uncharacterized protein n=1 Tax=Parathielavia appendiculata TaxID=2587402 RepID=A0AAN6U0B4_9PEZI|nr:hypothetical protein N657DRAFT_376236 [Parathielavia appendiculata]